MDALEFLIEERRMCNSFDIGCVKCPLGDIGCCVSPEETDEEFEREIAIVEQWSKGTPAQDAAERISGAVSGGTHRR